MAKITINISKDVETREELDAYVRTHFGEDPVANKENVIVADEATLTALSLSEDSTIFGVRIQKEKKTKK